MTKVRAQQWVYDARHRAGLSQRELAERAGVPQPTIARIEGGRQLPRVDTLERLLEACGWRLEMVPGTESNDLSMVPDSLPRLAGGQGLGVQTGTRPVETRPALPR